jgi:O-antigen/teichoic acid export membrane protein
MVIMESLKKILFTFIRSGLSDEERKHIVDNTFYSFVIQGVSVILVFAGNLFLTRWAGAAAYGQYVHVFNWISVLSMIALGGREDLLVARIPKYMAENEERQIKKLLKRTNLDIFFRSLLITGLFLALIYWLDIKTLSDIKTDFLAGSVAIYLLSFITLNQCGLQALHHIALSQTAEKLVKPFLLIVLIILVKMVTPSITVKSLIWIANASLWICAVLIIYWVISKTRHFNSPGKVQAPPANFSKQTFYFFLISLLYLLSTKMSMLILPYFMSEKNVGIFNIAYRFADLLIYPFALMHYVLPQLFARHHASDTSYKQSLFSESAILMTIISVPILLTNILAGKFFLGWFGPEFTSGYQGLIYLSIAQFLFSFFGPANTILMMQGKEKYAALSLFIYLIILFITSILIIPVMGITGAAISVCISILLYNIILAVITYRLSGVISPFLSFLIPGSAKPKK